MDDRKQGGKSMILRKRNYLFGCIFFLLSVFFIPNLAKAAKSTDVPMEDEMAQIHITANFNQNEDAPSVCKIDIDEVGGGSGAVVTLSKFNNYSAYVELPLGDYVATNKYSIDHWEMKKENFSVKNNSKGVSVKIHYKYSSNQEASVSTKSALESQYNALSQYNNNAKPQTSTKSIQNIKHILIGIIVVSVGIIFIIYKKRNK